MKTINKTLVAAICSLSVITCSNPAPRDNQLTRKEKKEGWQLLFDGKSMEGWRRIYTDSPPKRGWHVADGCLTVEDSKGGESSNGGDLITVKEYGNFDLTFDFKLTPGANSGIKYFVNEAIGDPNSGYGYGPEYQVIDEDRVKNVPLGGKLAGLYELIEAPDTKKVNPVGEWNTGRIVSKDNRVEHWLNGELMFTYVLGSDEFKALVQKSKFKDKEGYAAQSKGHILIQDHGKMVSYKNIKIRELTTTVGAEGWKAGVAKVNITPQESMRLAGYAARDHSSEGILLDLWVKTLVLEDAAGNRSVLVTSDLLEFPKQVSDRIREQLKNKLGLDKAQIILNASHTHSGPILPQSALTAMYKPFSEQEKEKIDRYGSMLEQQIVDMVVKASKSLEPVTLAAANGIARVQVNRRNNTERTLTPLTELKGPNDYAVPVLKVTNASGQIKAIVFGYACHPTVLDINLWSGDFPGFAQAELEKWYPDAIALFFQGAGADMNPLPRRSIPLAKQYGVTLAAAVDRTLHETMKPLPATLKTAYKEVMLPLDTPYSEADLTEIANQSEFNKRIAQPVLDKIKIGQSLPRFYPYPVQAWNIGGLPLFALGGELTIGYAIQLKQKYGEDSFVLGFSNDVMAYIPTLTVLKEGGYEGASSQLEYGLPGHWAPEIETVIHEGIAELAKQVNVVQK